LWPSWSDGSARRFATDVVVIPICVIYKPNGEVLREVEVELDEPNDE
jgi:hypothetical protein